MTAYKEAREMARVISTLRNEEGFSEIYEKSTELASTIPMVPVKKRVTNRQQNTENTPSQSTEEHFIDHMTSQLNTSLVENSKPAILTTYLIPSALSKPTKQIKKLWCHGTKEDHPQPDSVDQEMEGKEPSSNSADIDRKINIGSHRRAILPEHPLYHLPHSTSDQLFM